MVSSGADAPNLETLANRFDLFDMGKVIEGFPGQIEAGLAQHLPFVPKDTFAGAAVVGMGGSALPADVVNAAFQDKLKVPLTVVRHYQLPAFVTEDHLIIASSFSGGTEETLAAIEHVPAGAMNVVCVTTGGPLLDLARDRKLAHVQMDVSREPPGFQPRSAVGYFVTFFSRILSAAGLMMDTTAELGAVPEFLRNLDLSDDAEEIARWLANKIPVVYCDETYALAIARTTKIKFNENSKMPAFFNAFPESNHNEMIGFSRNIGEFGVLYFHDPESHPTIGRRFALMERIFSRRGMDHVAFRKWVLPGKTKIEKIFAALALAERTSYNIALLNGFDPTPVDMVEEFKAALVEDDGGSSK